MQLKKQLYQACQDFVKDKEEEILKTLKSNQEALAAETKSSAGDKHETGRAMLQLEMEKASQQWEGILKMKPVLQRVDTSRISDIAALGSVIITDKANYYLTISAGALSINEKIYYAVSVNSPIGTLLLGRNAGDVITLNNEIKIKQIY
ncbi:MAG: 3-oxoacyl-ACP synthase [Flavobacteriaceae bacterium]|nr:3-oxoacyl-ACP synthase [Flavobacteriaceae bacterium]